MIEEILDERGSWLAGLLVVIGCENKANTKATDKKDGKIVGKADDKKADANNGGHDWWCDDHGVKEEECSMCNAKVAKAFQDKGDWCKDHNRAKSQCFICDPKLKEKFAADYVAKYGKDNRRSRKASSGSWKRIRTRSDGYSRPVCSDILHSRRRAERNVDLGKNSSYFAFFCIRRIEPCKMAIDIGWK